VSGGGYTGLGDDAAGSRPLDTANRKIEKRLAAFDTPHNLVLSWGYELPLGKGNGFFPAAARCEPDRRRLAGQCDPAIRERHSIGVGGGGVIPLSNGGNRPNVVLGASPAPMCRVEISTRRVTAT
jgi:hypothetical protein